MKSVGVRPFKARQSESLRVVKGAETILVTDRDEVASELRLVRRQRRAGDDAEGILRRLGCPRS